MVVDVPNSLVGCASRGISHVWSLRQTLGEAFNGNEKKISNEIFIICRTI
jgi:hypothetical protein